MAMGLSSFGRRSRKQFVELSFLHVAGAAAGGLATSAALGSVGAVAHANDHWAAIILASAIVAAWLGRTPYRTCGLSKQVPRRWEDKVAPSPLYFVWGMMLGSGVITAVTRTAFLVVLASWAAAGLPLALVGGVTYGTTRQGVSVWLAATGWDMAALGDLPRRLFRFSHVGSLTVILLTVAATSTVAIR